MLSDAARVLVVERGDAIVGCWVLMPIMHAECVWIDPQHRKGLSVARRLWVGMRQLAASLGVAGVVTSAVSDDVRALLNTRAMRLPGDHFLIQWERERCQ